MAGIPTTCRDNPKLGIIGCGARYSGELQHSVARVPWSIQPDGRAHITLSPSTATKWDRAGMPEPAALGLVETSPGRWGFPLDDAARERLAAGRAKTPQEPRLPFGAVQESDVQTSERYL